MIVVVSEVILERQALSEVILERQLNGVSVKLISEGDVWHVETCYTHTKENTMFTNKDDAIEHYLQKVHYL